MSQKYRLVERRNLGKDADVTPRKYYAQAINNGYVSFDELCVDISEYCSATSADVKAILDRMNYTLDKHLRAGRIVQFGEIGNFRLSVSSDGTADEKSFNAHQIRKAKIIFTPGKSLQTTRALTTFEKVVNNECEKPHAI